MRQANTDRYRLNSVDRVVAVLDALASVGPAPLELAARTSGLTESTALRYLSSLVGHGLAERDPQTGRYRLGLDLYRLGRIAVSSRSIDSVARPLLEEIRGEVEETVNLAGRQGNRVILLDVLQSPRSLRNGVTTRGESDYWHSTSLGKALLAAMPEEEMLEIVSSEELIAFTPSTLTSVEALVADLLAVRKRGYAIDDEESDEGLRCVGAVVKDLSGTPRYAISISGPKSRMPYSRLDELGARLQAASRGIARALGHDGPLAE